MSTPNTHEGASRIASYLRNCTQSHASVFFIGVGGVMMSSLALLTLRAGHPTVGSDRAQTAVTAELEAAGIRICYGHAAEHLPDDCGLVVYTVAISPDNPDETYRDIVHPINSQFRAVLEKAVIDAYYAALEAAETAEDEDAEESEIEVPVEF